MTAYSLSRPRSFVQFLPALAVMLAVAGCGGDKGQRVSGKVTFKGQPVPAGKIYFAADGAKGNTGQTGYANITNGTYDTSADGGMGAPKGPVIVGIEGIDPSGPGKKEKGDTSADITTKLLFPRYETSLEIAGDTTKDFEVPADAEKGPKAVGQPIIVP